jgi:oligopeptide/dipeptide ABC transporter ATP-binding protein
MPSIPAAKTDLEKAMNHLLDVQNLRTTFHTRTGDVPAVSGIDFYVDRGETLGIVGESGCGKSVTALSLMRLLPMPPAEIDGEHIFFDNDDILAMDDDELRKLRGGKMSMIFQDPMTSLNPVYTVGFQIAESVQTHMHTDSKQSWSRAVEMLERVGIPNAGKRAQDYPHEFSGGMRQRVMIAIALSCNPALIIADEPTTALDVTIQAQILDLMRALSREFDTAVILITHDMGIVAGMTQRTNVMYAGKIVEAAATKQLFAMPAHPYTQALLQSIPRLDDPVGTRLMPVKGQPPDLLHLPQGCSFAPRCPKVQSRCLAEIPPLMDVGTGQKAACFYPY